MEEEETKREKKEGRAKSEHNKRRERGVGKVEDGGSMKKEKKILTGLRSLWIIPWL